jgi:hypothetical protein
VSDRRDLPTVADSAGRRPIFEATTERAPTRQQLIVLEILSGMRGQRYARPRTERQAMARITDLAAQTERKPVQLPPGRSYGVPCPRCAAAAGEPCRDLRNGRPLKQAHPERRKRYAKQRRRASRAAKADRRWAESWSHKGVTPKRETS